MKVIISYPPLANEQGCPTLGQNRQFQYFKQPTFIYPVVPATAATLLSLQGHEVIWNDCLAEGCTYDEFLALVRTEAPDLIAFETKTPVVKQHWKIINEIKRQGTGDREQGTENARPIVVLFGDHVTALPEESFEHSAVDYVLTGGDYDFLLLNLCNSIEADSQSKTANRKPITGLEPGIYYRNNGIIKNTGTFQLNHDLDSLPFIDRELTRWRLYAFENGNYKRTPGTYLMSGRDCWWGKCTFCSWPTLYPRFRVRRVGSVVDEIGFLVERYGVREVMDDTGCFSAGDWLREFCSEVIRRGFPKRVYLDCNMRFGALAPDDFALMKKAGFRLLLFGLESAQQSTLDRINKQLSVDRVIDDCRRATKAGLYPHITIMFGYPWENMDDARRTLALGRWLLKKGYASTMQATLVIPYPGSALFRECKEKGWLKTLDWNDYDMKQPVMRTPIPDDALMRVIQGMYRVSFDPEFLLRKLFSIRDADDIAYYLRALVKVSGHLFDFKKHPNASRCACR